MKKLEKNLKETKKELVAIFEGYAPGVRITEDFLYLFRNDGTLDYHHPSYISELDEKNLKLKQTERQLKDFYTSEDWTPGDAAQYFISEVYTIYL